MPLSAKCKFDAASQDLLRHSREMLYIASSHLRDAWGHRSEVLLKSWDRFIKSRHQLHHVLSIGNLLTTVSLIPETSMALNKAIQLNDKLAWVEAKQQKQACCRAEQLHVLFQDSSSVVKRERCHMLCYACKQLAVLIHHGSNLLQD